MSGLCSCNLEGSAKPGSSKSCFNEDDEGLSKTSRIFSPQFLIMGTMNCFRFQSYNGIGSAFAGLILAWIKRNVLQIHGPELPKGVICYCNCTSLPYS